jgi:hypothetical protein
VTKILEKHNLLSLLPMAALSSAASAPGTIDSFSLIGTQTTEGEDYMLIEMPETEAAPAEVSPALELDPNITTETLHAQLAEMKKTMSSLGLDAKQGLGTDAQGLDAKTLEKEALTLLVDKNDSTYEIEDWESHSYRPYRNPWHDLPGPSRMASSTLSSAFSVPLLGRQPWWRRSWRSTASPNGLRSTMRC